MAGPDYDSDAKYDSGVKYDVDPAIVDPGPGNEQPPVPDPPVPPEPETDPDLPPVPDQDLGVPTVAYTRPMWYDDRLEWVATTGETLAFHYHQAAPFAIVEGRVDGIHQSPTRVLTRRGPRQIGATARQRDVEPRTIAFQVGAISESYEEMLDLREQLIRALAVGDLDPDAGRLSVWRSRQSGPVRISAVPVDSPKLAARPFHDMETNDLEFYCADPLFRGPEEIVSLELGAAGGISFPIQLPWQFAGASSVKVAENVGTTITPVTVQMAGVWNTLTLTNRTTGDLIQIAGANDPGDIIEIETGFGQKRATRISADGSRNNALNRVAAASTFFSLIRGANELSVEANSNTSGIVTVSWQPRYSAVV